MPKKVIGQFELQEKLGAGAMGVVYEAIDRRSGKRIALKFLPPEFSDNPRRSARFEREMAILKRLKHPHIVRCYGGMTYKNQRLFAMELVNGGSLKDLIQKRERLPWQEVVDYGIQMCSGLAHAHENGVIHRDIKPANMLLTTKGKIKVSDFGIARDVDATALTAAGKTVGTLGYMAPEQIRADQSVSKRTDLYSLGCTLFEMLTGRLPFEGTEPAKVIFQHIQEPPPRVSSLAMDCPIWLERLIGHLLEKDPDKRPLDALMVATALEEVERKTIAQVSSVQHDATGEPTALRDETAFEQAVHLVKKKKKKKKKKAPGPIWERTWFLTLSLLVIVAGVTWAAWPLNIHQLHNRAEKLMNSDDPVKWMTAQSRFIVKLKDKDTNGLYRKDIQSWMDRVEMYKAEQEYKIHRKFNQPAESEPERLYASAYEYEKNGDRITALAKYRSMVNLLEDHPEWRPYINLATRQIKEIEQIDTSDQERIEIITKSLDRADLLYDEGKRLEANRIWEDIVSLYGGNEELKPLVERAREKL